MKIVKYIRTIMAAIGLITLWDVVGKVGYYSEIGQSEPRYLWVLAAVGVAMMLPGIICELTEDSSAEKEN